MDKIKKLDKDIDKIYKILSKESYSLTIKDIQKVQKLLNDIRRSISKEITLTEESRGF